MYVSVYALIIQYSLKAIQYAIYQYNYCCISNTPVHSLWCYSLVNDINILLIEWGMVAFSCASFINIYSPPKLLTHGLCHIISLSYYSTTEM